MALLTIVLIKTVWKKWQVTEAAVTWSYENSIFYANFRRKKNIKRLQVSSLKLY